MTQLLWPGRPATPKQHNTNMTNEMRCAAAASALSECPAGLTMSLLSDSLPAVAKTAPAWPPQTCVHSQGGWTSSYTQRHSTKAPPAPRPARRAWPDSSAFPVVRSSLTNFCASSSPSTHHCGDERRDSNQMQTRAAASYITEKRLPQTMRFMWTRCEHVHTH